MMPDETTLLTEWQSSQPQEEYYSCSYLEGGLVFNVNTVNACCVTQFGMGWPHLSHLRDGPPDFHAIQKERIRIVGLNQTHQYPQCANCIRLKKQAWPTRTHLFHTIQIAHFRFCNIACSYCSVPRRTSPPVKPRALLPYFTLMQEKGLLAPNCRIVWGGGEPTILKEFEALMELFEHRDFRHVIYTNCVRYSPRICGLLARRRAQVICSVDSATSETYYAIKKRNHSDVVWRNITTYAMTGGDMATKIILVNENLPDAEKFLLKSAESGIRKVVCDIDVNSPTVPAEFANAIVTINQLGRQLGIQVVTGSFLAQALREDRGHALSLALDEAERSNGKQDPPTA